MEDYIFLGENFSDLIRNSDDMKMFMRIRELEKELARPLSECYNAVIEVETLRCKLQGRTPTKFIVVKDPTLN